MDVAEGLRAAAARAPDAVALRWAGGTRTYAELDRRVDQAAAALRGLGLEPGDRVGLLLGNVEAFPVALYGAWRAGLVAVPVNPGSTAAEVRHVLGDAGARAAVAAADLAALVTDVRPDLPKLRDVLVAGESFEAALAAAGTAGQGRGGDGDGGLALLQYTSGTTGRPRGAMLTHAALAANHAQMAATRLAVEPGDLVLCVLPLFHIYALNVALAFPLSRGAAVLLVDRFDARATLAEVADAGVTVVIGAPPIFTAWAAIGAEGLDLSAVRYAVSGAAALPVEVLTRFADRTGIAIWEGYGLTETAPLVAATAMNDAPRAGSVGRPVPDLELRLLDDHGAQVAEGDPGEVVVRGPNVFAGYWQDPEGTAAVLDADGWFRTGDIGYLDAGDLFLVDRKKDIVIVNGFNVYPREIEEVLFAHPAVADAAVVGVPHATTGEALRAVVVLRDGATATAEELIAHCRGLVARYKTPTEVAFAAALPHVASGKVRRRDLREP